MLVSHNKQFIFIKTRKTAGTSLEGLLEPFCAPTGHAPRHVQPFLETEYGIIGGRAGGERTDDPLQAHSSAEQIRAHLGNGKFRSYLKVYGVRNPFDKVVSWFWHVMPETTRLELAVDFDKARWLFQNWLWMRPVLPIDDQFYRTKKGPFKAHIIRYEQMAEDLSSLSEKLQIDIHPETMPAWKTQARQHRAVSLSSYYDDASANVVRRHFRRDFDRFGYSAEVPK